MQAFSSRDGAAVFSWANEALTRERAAAFHGIITLAMAEGWTGAQCVSALSALLDAPEVAEARLNALDELIREIRGGGAPSSTKKALVAFCEVATDEQSDRFARDCLRDLAAFLTEEQASWLIVVLANMGPDDLLETVRGRAAGRSQSWLSMDNARALNAARRAWLDERIAAARAGSGRTAPPSSSDAAPSAPDKTRAPRRGGARRRRS